MHNFFETSNIEFLEHLKSPINFYTIKIIVTFYTAGPSCCLILKNTITNKLLKLLRIIFHNATSESNKFHEIIPSTIICLTDFPKTLSHLRQLTDRKPRTRNPQRNKAAKQLRGSTPPPPLCSSPSDAVDCANFNYLGAMYPSFCGGGAPRVSLGLLMRFFLRT